MLFWVVCHLTWTCFKPYSVNIIWQEKTRPRVSEKDDGKPQHKERRGDAGVGGEALTSGRAETWRGQAWWCSDFFGLIWTDKKPQFSEQTSRKRVPCVLRFLNLRNATMTTDPSFLGSSGKRFTPRLQHRCLSPHSARTARLWGWTHFLRSQPLSKRSKNRSHKSPKQEKSQRKTEAVWKADAIQSVHTSGCVHWI